MPIRYSAACCQTDLPNPLGRLEMRANTDRMLSMIDSAMAGAAPFLPVRLVVFPEFAHAAPVYATVAELAEKLAVPIPNEHTDRLRAKAQEHGIYIQSGTMIEVDPRWPGVVFNTTCLIGPDGILYKYRKVNPWIPYEVHASPHDLPGYDEPLFPVADTRDRPHRLRDLLRLALPRGDAPARRERRRGAGARLGLHGPVGRDRADGLVDGREPLPRAREHGLRRRRQPGGAACGTTRRTRGPAAAWSSTSTAASWPRPRPGPGERIVVGAGRRDARCATSARRGAGTTCSRTCAPRPTRSTAGTSTRRAGAAGPLSYEENNARIDAAKKSLA